MAIGTKHKASKATPKKSVELNSPNVKDGDASLPETNGQKELNRCDVAARAYLLWKDRGCRHGHDCDDWYEAERQLSGHCWRESGARA